MLKEYLAFVSEFGVNSILDLEEEKEIALVVKDLTPGRYKYESRYVKAKIGKLKDIPTADVLHIRFANGELHPKKYAISITEELGELPPPSTK